MIIALTLENFGSFLGETTVSFAASKSPQLAGNLLRRRNGERIVKSMALYGSNASGKTTVLDGLHALTNLVRLSGHDRKPTSIIPHFEPFELDRSSKTVPSRIAVTVEMEGGRFTLDVSATAERVWTESLRVQHITKQPSRKSKAKVLIERQWTPDTDIYATRLAADVGPELTRCAAIEQTTPNRLMLGKLAALNSTVARRVFEWFDEDLCFYDTHRNQNIENEMLDRTASLVRENRDFAASMVRFLRDADVGIKDLHSTDEIAWEPPSFVDHDNTIRFHEVTKPVLFFRHTTKDGSEVLFRRQQESSGTLRFVAMLTAILQPRSRPHLVCIDEISASMHPDLVQRLIRVVHSGKYNPLGSQVLFTTHDTHLMDPDELLRRDQITLCEKDRFGRSTTTRLDQFQDAARSDANLQKQYLQGRFGGLPRFGPTLEDVPLDDEPLEVGR